MLAISSLKAWLALSLAILLLPLSAFAASSAGLPQKSTSALNINADQLLCVKQAVDNRETAIMKALNKFYTNMSQLLEARRALIKKAWDIKDGKSRRANIQAIWKKFGFAWKNNSDQLRDSMREAWQSYRIARTECKIAGYDEETGGMGMDSQF